MSDSVETLAPQGMPQDDAAASNYVDVSELMNDSAPTVAPVEQNATVPQPQDDAAKDSTFNQTDINHILGVRIDAERARMTRRYESSPEYQLGQMLIRDRASREGISAEEAFRKIQSESITQRAEQYAKDPKAFYADYLTQQTRPNATPTPPPNTPPAVDGATLTSELLKAGAQEMGFLPQHITAQFVADAQQFGVQAALSFWQRSQSASAPTADAVVSQLEQRKRAPQPIRPVGKPSTATTMDYSEMSSEDFKKLDAKLRQATLDGRRVKL